MINDQLKDYCDKWGGYLLKDKSGDFYFSNDDDAKKYYEKYNKESGKFELNEWRCGQLRGLDLEIVYPE